jgi:hypothetical protein
LREHQIGIFAMLDVWFLGLVSNPHARGYLRFLRTMQDFFKGIFPMAIGDWCPSCGAWGTRLHYPWSFRTRHTQAISMARSHKRRAGKARRNRMRGCNSAATEGKLAVWALARSGVTARKNLLLECECLRTDPCFVRTVTDQMPYQRGTTRHRELHPRQSATQYQRLIRSWRCCWRHKISSRLD